MCVKQIYVLLNLIEKLNLKNKQLEEENQKLRDEINRLNGEQGKPDIKGNKKKELKKDHSSEKERFTPKEHRKKSKNKTIKISREEIVVYPQEQLPADAQFKGYVRAASRREGSNSSGYFTQTRQRIIPETKILLTSNGKNVFSAPTNRI